MTAPRFDQATRIKMLEAGVWQRGDGSLNELHAMPDGHLVNALLRETGHQLTPEEMTRMQQVHRDTYAREVAEVRPLPGARGWPFSEKNPWRRGGVSPRPRPIERTPRVKHRHPED